MKKYLYEYKNSVIAFYTHIFILFTSFSVVCLFNWNFESGEECILAMITSVMYFLSGVFFLNKEKSKKLFKSLIHFFIYLVVISILAPLSGNLSMLILFINPQGLIFIVSVKPWHIEVDHFKTPTGYGLRSRHGTLD